MVISVGYDRWEKLPLRPRAGLRGLPVSQSGPGPPTPGPSPRPGGRKARGPSESAAASGPLRPATTQISFPSQNPSGPGPCPCEAVGLRQPAAGAVRSRPSTPARLGRYAPAAASLFGRPPQTRSGRAGVARSQARARARALASACAQARTYTHSHAHARTRARTHTHILTHKSAGRTRAGDDARRPVICSIGSSAPARTAAAQMTRGVPRSAAAHRPRLFRGLQRQGCGDGHLQRSPPPLPAPASPLLSAGPVAVMDPLWRRRLSRG